MGKTSIENIRNVVLAGHGGVGKTALAEAMLYAAGAVSRLGRVEEGNTATDYDEEEIKRGNSVSAAVVNFDHGGCHYNLIDLPGSADFICDVPPAIRVADVVIIVVNAAAGMEIGTERAWRYADEYGVPRAVFINRMDRDRADFNGALKQLSEAFSGNLVPFTLPIGAAGDFRGVIDVIHRKAHVYGKGLGKDPSETEVPEELTDRVNEVYMALVEAAVETDDGLMEKYFADEELTAEEIAAGLRRGISDGSLMPVFAGDAFDNAGIKQMLDLSNAFFPSPADARPWYGSKPGTDEDVERPHDAGGPLSAFVFKTAIDMFAGRLNIMRVISGSVKVGDTVYDPNVGGKVRVSALVEIMGKKQSPVNELKTGEFGAVVKAEEIQTGHTLCDPKDPIQFPVIEFPEPLMQYAIFPKSKGDEDKLMGSLTKLTEEDPTFAVTRNVETKQTIASGMGEQHLAVMLSKLSGRFGVDVDYEIPKVAYRETITKSAAAQGRYKKQTGGRGQYGDVYLRLEPLEKGAGFEFVNKIVGGVVPNRFIPSVEKGVIDAMGSGVVAGYPVVDVQVTLYDGSYHTVDSSDMAFQIAGSLGFKKAMGDAVPVLIEPIMEVEVTVPEEFMGDINGDLSAKRGRVLGMEPAGIFQKIKALVPIAEMFRYSIDLRSITGGKGSFTMRFSHYEGVPREIAGKIIEQTKKTKDEEGK
jgi:elongation factor G